MQQTLGLLFDPPGFLWKSEDAEDLRADSFPLESVDLFFQLLSDRCFRVVRIPGTRSLCSLVASATDRLVDGIINLSSGFHADFRLGQGPLLSEMMGVPYSGPDPLTTLLCRDKNRCKSIVARRGVVSPVGLCVTSSIQHIADGLRDSLFPAIVKPNAEGSSLGVSPNILYNKDDVIAAAVNLLRRYPGGILIEKFIPGIEVTVLLIGTPPSALFIPMVLMAADGSKPPPSFIYGFDAKSKNVDSPTYFWEPAKTCLKQEVLATIEGYSRVVSELLRLRDLARLDFRVSPHGKVFFIECNSHPVLELGNSITQRINSTIFHEEFGVENRFLDTTLSRMSLS